MGRVHLQRQVTVDVRTIYKVIRLLCIFIIVDMQQAPLPLK